MENNMIQKFFQLSNVTDVANSDSNPVEKDLKVDKKVLDVMRAGGNESQPPLNDFLHKIQKEAGVLITISSSLRDRQGNEVPVLKVRANNQKCVDIACALIMERLDPHRDKMSFNIDVPFNDHSYIIGKDGARIKNLSRSTGCHIHLPDCNKTSAKKSNKLSIAGTDFASIDRARDQIRKSLPLNVAFKAQIKTGKFVIIDTASAEVQAVKRQYKVDVTFTNVISNTKNPEVTINVKGGRSQMEEIEQASRKLYHYITEEDLANCKNIVFTITIDVSHSHHQFVKGKNNCNLRVITYRSGANILFPPNDPPNNQVVIQSHSIFSAVMGWQELMGYLPLLLSFDVNFDITKFTYHLNRIEKEYGVGIRTREKLFGHVYTVLIKTQERHSTYLQEIRQKILDLKHPPARGLANDHFGSFRRLSSSNGIGFSRNDENLFSILDSKKEALTFCDMETSRQFPFMELDLNNNSQQSIGSPGSDNFYFGEEQSPTVFRPSASGFSANFPSNNHGMFVSNGAPNRSALNELMLAASPNAENMAAFLTNYSPMFYGNKTRFSQREKSNLSGVTNIPLTFNSETCFRCEAENSRSKQFFQRF